MKKTLSLILSAMLIASFSLTAHAAEPAAKGKGIVVGTEKTAAQAAVETVTVTEDTSAAEPAVKTVEPTEQESSAPSAGSSTEAYRLYRYAMEKMENEPLQMTGKMTAALSGDSDDSFEISADIVAKYLVNSAGKPEMSVVTRSDFGRIEQYYKNGYMYTNMDGNKTKIPMPETDAKDSAFDVESDIPGEYFEDATVEDVEGGKRIRVKLGGDYMNQLVAESLDKQMAGEADAVLDTIQMGGMTLLMTVGEDGRLKSYQMYFDIKMALDETDITVKYSVALKIDPANRFMQIDFPADLAATYKLV